MGRAIFLADPTQERTSETESSSLLLAKNFYQYILGAPSRQSISVSISLMRLQFRCVSWWPLQGLS